MAGKKYHGEGKIGDNHNICGLSAREICPVSRPVFFGKYHLQALYISIQSFVSFSSFLLGLHFLTFETDQFLFLAM
jgi:hypothetical protein